MKLLSIRARPAMNDSSVTTTRADSERIQMITAAATRSGRTTAPTCVSGSTRRDVIADRSISVIHHPALGERRSLYTVEEVVVMASSSHTATGAHPLCRVAP